MQLTDLTNQNFGRLTALYRLDKPGRAVWHCVCICGRETDVGEYNLKSGHSRSCGCRRPGAWKDLTGQRFGKLVALYPTSGRECNCVVWHCTCDCGGEADYASSILLRGSATTCGCSRAGEDLTGRTFGNWTVIRKAERRQYWICQCACGTEKAVSAQSLRRGASRSCGCLPYPRKDISGEKRGHLTALRQTGKIIDSSTEYVWRCDCGNEVTLPLSRVYGSRHIRMCPECAAKKRREPAKEIQLTAKGKAIHGMAATSLKRLQEGKPQSNNTSGVRGVWKQHGKWVASGFRDGKRVYLGAFDELKDVQKARERFVQETYGEAFEKIK